MSYRVVPEVMANGATKYTAQGPGLSYDKPVFTEMSQAESFCRCLARAFEAGEKHRSAQIKALIEDRVI